MASDLNKVSNLTISAFSEPRARDKVRLRFRKGGHLRLISHRDLMKCFERALRRAELPVHVTQGFHPLPRMVFAMALSLGIVGLDEVLELEFSQPIEPEEARRRLSAQMPPGLEIVAANRIPVKSSAQVRRAGYRVGVPPEQLTQLPRRIDALLATKDCWIERDRPTRRRLNLRTFISEIRLIESPSSGGEGLGLRGYALEMLLWVTPNGAARPNEILQLLDLPDLVESGAVLERHVLELYDETEQSGSLPEAPGSCLQPMLPATAAPRDAERLAQVSPPTALISGPMSFDS